VLEFIFLAELLIREGILAILFGPVLFSTIFGKSLRRFLFFGASGGGFAVGPALKETASPITTRLVSFGLFD
jgi:hypothetical protein